MRWLAAGDDTKSSKWRPSSVEQALLVQLAERRDVGLVGAHPGRDVDGGRPMWEPIPGGMSIRVDGSQDRLLIGAAAHGCIWPRCCTAKRRRRQDVRGRGVHFWRGRRLRDDWGDCRLGLRRRRRRQVSGCRCICRRRGRWRHVACRRRRRGHRRRRSHEKAGVVDPPLHLGARRLQAWTNHVAHVVVQGAVVLPLDRDENRIPRLMFCRWRADRRLHLPFRCRTPHPTVY